ncbi:MAG: DNA-directed RNA polymerase subunit beta [Christensenellaceae bacterium]|jgi:DNA-directed RNA polymerase subunit beta|nr:DNA-directed RNA polymerase subunit beta [Christensenellaceae bacterium]
MFQRIHKVKRGQVERWSFGKIKDILDIPYLIEVQKKSYEAFLKKGIRDVFADFSPIVDYSGKLELEFLEHSIDGECKYNVNECKDRDATYTMPLRVKIRLTMRETGKMLEQTVFMGDFPKMTENGTFVINGAERVVVSQLVRSPGVYTTISEKNSAAYATTIIPSRGAWLEFEQDISNTTGITTLSVRVDRTRKIPATLLLRALGFGTNAEISDLFDADEIIMHTAERDADIQSVDLAKIEVYRKLRPGEMPTQSGVEAHLSNIFFDAKRYDLSRVGRYKFNKQLCIANRITDKIAAEDIISADGEILAELDQKIDRETALKIQAAGINIVKIKVNVGVDETRALKVIGNNMIDLAPFIDCDPLKLGINEYVYYPTLRRLIDASAGNSAKLKHLIAENRDALIIKHITLDDIIASISYNLNIGPLIKNKQGAADNIDHLANRRVRSVGELLQNQFRIGISRLERVIRERMSIAPDPNEITPQSLINIRPVSSAIREFFGSSQLSQFMDQPNPIAELTHKRKLSALGPGGLNRERAGFEVRDVHHSHYGRMCPIETPEGQNIGLITSLSSYAKVNQYGFIEAPYRKVDKETGVVTETVEYLDADREDNYTIAQANEPLDEQGRFINPRVTCRWRDEIKEYSPAKVDYMDVSPQQLVSIATSLIPFLENDDANRALMGSNMQRQAVPLLKPESPIVGTGMEYKVARDSGVCILAKEAGTVSYVSATEIYIQEKETERRYQLQKFRRSNQGTCITQRPLVWKGDSVEAGDVIADGHSVQNGELALGRNILIGFMTWEGYNYEDAILISEELVKRDVFTSIHIEEYEIESRDTKLGEEQITRDIPNVSDDMLKFLDDDGIIVVGAEVRSGDYLVGKVTPKGETDLSPEERLLRAIFGEKSREVRDVSLRVPNGEGGIVVDIKVFNRANKDELPPGVNKLVRVYIAQKRKISVGDKMAGRHGNKGVISRVLPKEDMPFMADGTPLEIVLNPLGVPSRMNVGQVLEVHLGLVAHMLGLKVATPVFDGASENDIRDLLTTNGLPGNGKIQLFDGRTGEPFENPVTVGYMYMLKLVHLVDDKIHARSVGPYSLVTQQPLGGKAQFGGQRFGEMEVWALEAYGAANILQEILTVKSDDVIGRARIFNSIIKSGVTAEPGIPEAFKVLQKEMQSLCLDMRLLSENKEEIRLAEAYDDERDLDATDVKDVLTGGDFNLDFMSSETAMFDDSEPDVISELYNNRSSDFIETYVPQGMQSLNFEDSLFDDDEAPMDFSFGTDTSQKLDVEAMLRREFDDSLDD